MSPAQEQFARVKRYLARMEQKVASDEGTDDMYSFFLHAWHLIDWAGNDPAVGRTYFQLKQEVCIHFPHSIWLCADIADGSKHLVLTRPKPRDVPLPRRAIRMYAGNVRSSEASFSFEFPDGSIKDALTLAREVVANWEKLLTKYGLAV